MFCEKCGKENEDGMNFCEACGAPLPKPAEAQQEAPVEGVQEPAGTVSAEAAAAEVPEETSAGSQPAGMPVGAPVQPGGMPVNGMPGGVPVNGMPTGSPGGMPVNGMPTGAPVNGGPAGLSGMSINGAPVVNGMPAGAPVNGSPVQPGGMPMNGMPGGAPVNGRPAGAPGGMPMSGMPGGVPVNGGPAGAPGGMPMNGMPGGYPGKMPQSGPMYQMPPMQAVPPAQPKKSGGVKILIIVIVVLLVVLVGVLAAIGLSKRAKQTKIDGYLTSAEEKFDSQDYEAAIEDYQQVLDMDEDNGDAINGLTDTYVSWAQSLAAEGRYEEALDVLAEADSRAKSRKINSTMEEVEEAMMLSQAGGSGWTDADFVFSSDSDGSITLTLGHTFRVNSYYEESYMSDYSGDHDTYYSMFATGRGLKTGMTRDDYVSLYGLQEGYAVWELYTGEEGEYTSFSEYSGQTAAEMYEAKDAGNVWLDIGYCWENGAWRLMEDWEVRDVWFCDAPIGDYGDVMILSVNLYEDDRVYDISMEYFTYDDNWVTWQDWAD